MFALLLGYGLIRTALEPLREIVDNTGRITVDKLDTRLDASRAPRELRALVDAQNAMLGRLQQAFSHLSQFSADLAHDLRTPLNNMRGATEVALARPRPADEYQALLESHLEEYDRLARMIDNVLFLARAEHPSFVTRQRAFDVRDELERIAGYFEGPPTKRADAARRRAGRLTADVELFRRAIGNLLANALRYTPAGGVITLAVDETPDAVRVVVANPGEPIDPALLPRIFDRFVRGDPARSGGAPGGTAGRPRDRAVGDGAARRERARRKRCGRHAFHAHVQPAVGVVTAVSCGAAAAPLAMPVCVCAAAPGAGSACQPPPNAFNNPTSASIRRASIWSAVRRFVSAIVCAVTTSR